MGDKGMAAHEIRKSGVERKVAGGGQAAQQLAVRVVEEAMASGVEGAPWRREDSKK
jgi:hypothetical protein